MNIKEMLELLGPNDPLVRVMLREIGADCLSDLATEIDRYNGLADREEFLVVKEELPIACTDGSGVKAPSSNHPAHGGHSPDEMTDIKTLDSTRAETDLEDEKPRHTLACPFESQDNSADLLADQADSRAVVNQLVDATGIVEAIDRELLFFSSEGLRPNIKAGQRIGPYHLVSRIGGGGFGQVYSAYHVERPDQDFAIKIFANNQLAAVDRLEIEKFVLQKLQHPNLVAAVDSGRTESGITFLVMNLVEGESITRFVEQANLNFAQIAELFAVIASAIQYAHNQDVLHRDLKPSNILVTKQGVPVVVDFGLAKRLDPDCEHSITISGGLVGTLGYLSPEQAASSKAELTRAVDVYGLGATLYHVLTGRAPFERDNVLKSLQQIREDRPTPPKAINSSVPADLQKICLACLQKVPGDRYASMDQLSKDLRRFAAGERIVGCGLDWRAALWRWANENPALAWLSVGLIASILVGSLVSAWSWRQAIIRERRVSSVLQTAREILVYGDQSAEEKLQMTPGSLKYRKERLMQSVAFFDELVEQFPDHPELYRESATSWFRLGKVNLQLGNWAEGRNELVIALDRFQNLAVRIPENDTLEFDLFHCLCGLDWAESSLDKTYQSQPVEAQHCFEALEIISNLAAAHSDNIDYQDALACTAGTVGGRYARNGASMESLDHLNLAWQTASMIKKQLPEPCQQWAHIGGSACRLAELNRTLGNLEEALKWSDIARNEIQAYLNRDSLDPGELGMWVGWMCERIRLDRTMGKQDLADKRFEELKLYIKECQRKYPDFYIFQEFQSKLAEYEYAELKKK